MNARYFCTGCIVTALLFASFASAQTFSSGSTGSDGALNYPTPGTYTFNPAALNLDAAGDNIFNFTTINIANGVTLNMPSNLLRNLPVVWLASGNVTIAGSINLSGASAPNLASFGANWITQRVPTLPGPGGYPGGVGARPGEAESLGLGPGGGLLQVSPNCSEAGSASFATAGYGNPVAATYGNIQTVPLIGGSGGSGGCLPTTTQSDTAGGTGGAGGGAIRIVSTTSINIASTGSIVSQGGVGGAGRDGGGYGGGGSGGAINLIAPSVSGAGSLNVAGACSPNCNYPAGGGYILINATTNTYTGTTTAGVTTIRPLIAPPLPTPSVPPTITIVSVAAMTVPQPPQGQFQTPDVTINSATPVTINISAVGVPVGTQVQLDIVSELAADQIITCNALTGTTASSTATCSAMFPTSVSAILASAVW